MKKLFIFLLPFLSSPLWAQTSVGLKGSFTGSTLTKFDLIENVTPEFRMLPAAGGGVFVEIPLNEQFSIQPELNYIRKGFHIAEGFDVGGEFMGFNIPVNGKVDFRLNYVEVPLLAKVHIGDKSAAHYYLAAGPAVAYMADADTRVKVLDIFPATFNLNNDMFKPFELSGVVAAGFEVPVSEKLNVFTEARYTHGFSRVLDTPMVDLPVRSRTLAANLGFRITL